MASNAPQAACQDPTELMRYLSSFEMSEEYRAERDDYLEAHFIRFLVTLEHIPPATARARLLELGAPPYLLTLLLKRCTRYEIHVAGWRDDVDFTEFEDRRSNSTYGEEHVFRCKNFNVETDSFPYPDRFFDLILCCDVLEHLVQDPTRMLVSIHRVLRDGGQLLLTTPNVLVLRHVVRLLKGQNIYGPYSRYGLRGRHNREWTLAEVVDLISGCGFHIQEALVLDTYPHRGIVRFLKTQFPNLRDQILVLAQRYGEPVEYRPTSLYV